jgi:hypothetical protein
MTAPGTKLTLPTITRMSAFGGKADMAEEACRRPLLTQSGLYRIERAKCARCPRCKKLLRPLCRKVVERPRK